MKKSRIVRFLSVFLVAVLCFSSVALVLNVFSFSAVSELESDPLRGTWVIDKSMPYNDELSDWDDEELVYEFSFYSNYKKFDAIKVNYAHASFDGTYNLSYLRYLGSASLSTTVYYDFELVDSYRYNTMCIISYYRNVENAEELLAYLKLIASKVSDSVDLAQCYDPIVQTKPITPPYEGDVDPLKGLWSFDKVEPWYIDGTVFDDLIVTINSFYSDVSFISNGMSFTRLSVWNSCYYEDMDNYPLDSSYLTSMTYVNAADTNLSRQPYSEGVYCLEDPGFNSIVITSSYEEVENAEELLRFLQARATFTPYHELGLG